MTASNPLLVLDNVSLSRGDRPVLREVSLSLESGRRLALVGPNGAGKTTLLKCLNRILTGWSGSITLSGETLQSYSHRELARWMAYVPQTGGPIAPFSVEAFVALGRYPYQGPLARLTRQDKQAVNSALELTDTSFLRDRPMHAL